VASQIQDPRVQIVLALRKSKTKRKRKKRPRPFSAATSVSSAPPSASLKLSFLTARPGNQQSLIPDGQSMVLEIVAVEANAAQADERS